MKIGIDCDEVLAEFVDYFLLFYNERNKTEWRKRDLWNYDFWRVFNVSKEKAVKEVEEFYRSDLLLKLKPVEGSVEGIRELRNFYDMCIITARPEGIRDETAEWVKRHYGDAFEDEIYFAAGFGADSEKKMSKLQLCGELNVGVMAEDSFECALECSANRRRVYLFNKPWNSNRAVVPRNIFPVSSWAEFIEELHPI